MTVIAIQGPVISIEELNAKLTEEGQILEVFTSDGFDGTSIATILIEFVGTLAPSVAAVIAAKIATKKQIIVKVDGIEVRANNKNDALILINDLSSKKEKDG